MKLFDKSIRRINGIFVIGEICIKHNMVMKEKERYFSPEIEVMELKPEGVVCTSGEREDYTPIEW